MAQITDRQIAYIERLSRQRWQDEVAADMGCSASAAQHRATSADGSMTIDRLLAGKPKPPAREPRAYRTSAGDYL